MESIDVTQRIQEEISKLMTLTHGYVEGDLPAHKIERGLLTQLLVLGHTLLLYIIRSRISKVQEIRALPVDGVAVERKGPESRDYVSLFGRMSFVRPSYWSRSRGKFHVSDDLLELPPGSWSYNLQELLGTSASENDYTESVRTVNALLGLGLSGKSSQRNASGLGSLADDFYGQHPVKVEEEPVCFSVSFDGKGVPKVKKKAVGDGGNPKKHLGKGEKRNVMQMATVSVGSSFTPRQRDTESIINALVDDPAASPGQEQAAGEKVGNDNQWHKDIHRRAFLADQQKAIDYGIGNIKERMAHPDSRFVVPIDAGIGLEEKVLESVKKHGLEAQMDGVIIDIIHSSAYAWDAATAIFGEKSKQRSIWVRDVLRDLLESRTQKVIDGLEKTVQKGRLSESKQKQVIKTLNYYKNHQHNMDYKRFIQKGYPISSALVESACGHLVKQRMEQSGMRWESIGAQNIMDLRAINQNGDFEDFMAFVIKSERNDNFILAA
jgi:hypothetical protein